MLNTIIPPSYIPYIPYQHHDPVKGEELDEFINRINDDDDDELEDYEHTEETINNPKHKFPGDDSNIGDDPIYPEDDEIKGDLELPEEDLDDDEVTTSIGV
jgi:hypothetical protein